MSERIRLNDRQCHIFLRDMKEFGYTNLTFKEVRKIADDVASGTFNESDVVARIMVKQIDEAVEQSKRRI